MLTNLHETIAEQKQKELQVLNEEREGFDDNHEEVHAKHQHQLSRRNPRRATERELPLNKRTMPLEDQANIQETTQTTDMSFDYSQIAFAHALRMLDSSPSSLDNSQQLTLRLESESTQIPDQASPLSLCLNKSEDCLASVSDNTP